MITELKNPITNEYKNLKKFVLTTNVPWYYHDQTVPSQKNKDIPFFSHGLLGRPVHEIEGKKYPAIPEKNSNYFEKCYFVLKEILDFNNINFDVMYRMNLNLVLHNSLQESLPHIDLKLPHKVIIVYLNSFQNGRTIVLNKDNKKYFSYPKEDGAIMFDGKFNHCHEPPALDEKRLIMIANIQ
jgi:hypothetical protein